ncbi:MAG: hypothetical protein ABIO70_10645 [Pseudomonadota bacterium]
MSQTLPSLVGVEVMGRVLPPIQITEALASQSLAGTLASFLRPEAAMIWGAQETLGVSGGQAVRSFSPSARLSDLLQEFAGEEQITISLRAAAKGGGGWRLAPAREEEQRDLPLLDVADECMAKVETYGGAVTRRHGGVEFGGLLLGPADQPGVISDFVLLGEQRVNIGFFEAGERSVEDSLRRGTEGRPDLAPRGIIHRHPGYSGRYGVFHSATDDLFISGKLLPALAGESLRSVPWSKPLSNEGTPTDLRLPLDCFHRLVVVVRLQGLPEGAAPPVVEARLEGIDSEAEAHSLVFVGDGTCRSWSKHYRFVVAPTAGDQPRFFQEVEDRVYAVRRRPASQLGVTAAVSPSPEEAEAEVAREIEVGWSHNRYTHQQEPPEQDAWDGTSQVAQGPSATLPAAPVMLAGEEELREQVFDLAWQVQVLADQLMKGARPGPGTAQGGEAARAQQDRVFDLAWQVEDLSGQLMKLARPLPTTNPAEA